MKIAFIGLGNMGSHMARNLLRAGHEVTVWNRTLSKADEGVAGREGRDVARRCREGGRSGHHHAGGR